MTAEKPGYLKKSAFSRSTLMVILGAISLFCVYNYSVLDMEHQSIVYSSTVSHSSSHSDELVALGLSPRPSIEYQVAAADGSMKTKKIHGRFLHITDIHPDQFYKENSDVDRACHKGKGKVGKYGEALSGCDSPMILMEETMAWISTHLRDKIDFIVWTGDNIRHDNDRNHPRTESNIFDMNERVSNLFYETFKNGDPEDDPRNMDVELVPSLGNNDVFPHNLFAPGPTLQTRELWKIWKNYVPQSQMHVFERGAYFFNEVIPGKLAVLSINTLYLYQANPLVDNCDSRKEPGYKLFEWLGNVLKEFRKRNMKVWLSGHVPPNAKNYDISCLRKYVSWVHEYRDIIVGGLYGHMNLDHFIPLDSLKAYKSLNQKFGKLGYNYDLLENYHYDVEDVFDEDASLESLYEDFAGLRDDDFGFDLYNGSLLVEEDLDAYLRTAIAAGEARVLGGVPYGKVGYMELLREKTLAKIKGKKKSGEYSSRYSISHVTASVVPTFNPGIRVWEYNITGLEESLMEQSFEPWDSFFSRIDQELFDDSVSVNDIQDYTDDNVSIEEKVELFKRDKTFPNPMPSDLPLGPAYTPQLFSPTRYVQYFADLDKINKGKKEFGYEIEYTTDDDIYNMKSLLVDDWVQLSRKLAKPIKNANKEKKKAKKGKSKALEVEEDDVEAQGKKQQKALEKLWKAFLTRTFVNTGYEDMDL